jgi:hypothetical protein
MTRLMPLTKGKYAVVCDCHYDLVAPFKWQYGVHGYAVRTQDRLGERIDFLMHRVISNTPKGKHTDHVNGDKLDNQCSNLRTATAAQNQGNSKLSRSNTSGYKGVVQRGSRWGAQIRVGRALLWLGTYRSKKQAAQAYNGAALVHFGQFARVNE